MAKKIRDNVISLSSYLSDVKNGDVSDNQDVQRLFCWDNTAINELVVTVLSDDYIPPVILGEEELGGGLTQLYIIDGMQRTSALSKFRYGKYRITSSVENPVITYQVKQEGQDGETLKDDDGKILWEARTFNIKNKSYDDLPDELKRKFNNYQIRTVIHQNCTMEELSFLVRRYNNHISMRPAQKAFTFLDKYARQIRSITNGGFFKNCMKYSESERKNGTYEKLVFESVAATFYLDDWKVSPKKNAKFINSTATNEDFATIADYANRIESICGDRFTDLFLSKNLCVWFAVFHNFTKLGVEDKEFGAWMNQFAYDFRNDAEYLAEYKELESLRNTKNKKVIADKVALLTKLMLEYVSVSIQAKVADNGKNSLAENCEDVLNESEICEDYENNIDNDSSYIIDDDISNEDDFDDSQVSEYITFVNQATGLDVNESDIECYKDVFGDLSVNIAADSILLDKRNLPSFLALIAFSFEEEYDLDDWIGDFAERTSDYLQDQKENYELMKKDLLDFYGNTDNFWAAVEKEEEQNRSAC